jgi:hypothetical protein
MADQAPAAPTESSVADRLANYFGGDVAVQEEAAPAPETAEVEVPDQPEVPEGEEVPVQPETETAVAEQLVDVEVDGKVVKVPPEAKDALMRHADYTRKTMDLAEQRKQFLQQQELSNAQAAFQREIADESTQLTQLNVQLEQFKKLPWSEMDTDQMVRARQAQDSIKEQRDDVQRAIDAKKEQFLQRFSASKQQMIQQAQEYLRKTIPTGWGEASQTDAAKAAKAVGFSNEEIVNFLDPRAQHLAWKAAQWDKLQAAKPQVTNKVSSAPPVTKPGSSATTESQRSQTIKQQRERLRKTGDWKDAARLLLLKE